MLSFQGEEIFALRPTLKLEDHPLAAVRNCCPYREPRSSDSGDQMKKNEMGGACGTYGGPGEVHTGFVEET